MPVKWEIEDRNNVLLLKFEIEGGILDPSELNEVIQSMPEIRSEKPVCISGRGPVWLYSAVSIELAREGNIVATYEPRMNACIITSGPMRGQMFKLE